MQPHLISPELSDAQACAMMMERVIMGVRRLWFGARIVEGPCAATVVEPGGEMIMCVDGEGPAIDELVAGAARRGAYVVATSCTRPLDLGARLRRAGFRAVQTHGTLLLQAESYRTARLSPAPRRRGLLGLLRRTIPAGVEVHAIGPDELPIWNAVCWKAFGGRTSEGASLADKEQAFRAMGDGARWYLASYGGRPAGTALIYQAQGAAQVLAVGTLPSLRNRGVASALMQTLIDDWAQTGRGFVFLDTSPGSTAERIYSRLGFVPAYVREVYAPARSLA